jgi:hypothetical protein
MAPIPCIEAMGVPTSTAAQAVLTDLLTILAGRDTRWYKGSLLKLNILLVSYHK